ncbi:hypothetical protein C8Q75DRAFT_890002 [Abortiporus biennis]|nr:hypothetical protein C8Q75DRAFT_890002 [Abortiporus biennis]
MSSRHLQNVLRNSIQATTYGRSISSLGFQRRYVSAHAANAAPGALAKSDKKHHNTTSSVGLGHSKTSSEVLTKGKKANELTGRKERFEDISYEQRLAELEKVAALEAVAPFDVWAAPVDTYDLRIPSLTSKKKDASIGDHWHTFWSTQSNAFQNLVSMYRMASADSFPDVHVKSAFSFQLFKTQSTPWLEPFRKNALDTYQQVQTALASGDEKTLKKYAVAAYKEHLSKVLKARDPSKVYFWKFHGESSPTKVVSLRAVEANMGSEEPKFGNRLLIQALVKFDTLQSLQVYTRKGAVIKGEVAPKRVVEYLVFQKRMWQDAPWVIRDQVYEGLEGKFKTIS